MLARSSTCRSGAWNGRRVLAEQWIREATSFQSDNSGPRGRAPTPTPTGHRATVTSSGCSAGHCATAAGELSLKASHDQLNIRACRRQYSVIAITKRRAEHAGSALPGVWQHHLPAMDTGGSRPAPAAQACVADALGNEGHCAKSRAGRGRAAQGKSAAGDICWRTTVRAEGAYPRFNGSVASVRTGRRGQLPRR